MTVEYPGNLIPSPTFQDGNYTVDNELLYSTARFTQKGVTLASGQGILLLGTVLGRVTETKKWKVYDNTADDGTEVARGILRQTVDTSTTDAVAAGGIQANIVISGIVKNSLVSGADADAVTDLNARQDTVLDTFTF